MRLNDEAREGGAQLQKAAMSRSAITNTTLLPQQAVPRWSGPVVTVNESSDSDCVSSDSDYVSSDSD